MSVCGQETILLVEDEPLILKMTLEMLKLQGYTVLSAPSPEQAISIAREHAGKIHLLMTDVIMPGMNGPELVRQLLTRQPKLAYLYMSGYTANLIAEQGVKEEGTYFLAKPFSRQAIARKVRQALDGA